MTNLWRQQGPGPASTYLSLTPGWLSGLLPTPLSHLGFRAALEPMRRHSKGRSQTSQQSVSLAGVSEGSGICMPAPATCHHSLEPGGNACGSTHRGTCRRGHSNKNQLHPRSWVGMGREKGGEERGRLSANAGCTLFIFGVTTLLNHPSAQSLMVW